MLLQESAPASSPARQLPSAAPGCGPPAPGAAAQAPPDVPRRGREGEGDLRAEKKKLNRGWNVCKVDLKEKLDIGIVWVVR